MNYRMYHVEGSREVLAITPPDPVARRALLLALSADPIEWEVLLEKMRKRGDHCLHTGRDLHEARRRAQAEGLVAVLYTRRCVRVHLTEAGAEAKAALLVEQAA